jgi:hypothetical protein
MADHPRGGRSAVSDGDGVGPHVSVDSACARYWRQHRSVCRPMGVPQLGPECRLAVQLASSQTPRTRTPVGRMLAGHRHAYGRYTVAAAEFEVYAYA